MRADRPAWERALPWLAPLAAGLGQLALGLRELALGHPHEDAFILFEYARNLAAGEGIVFFAGGPHTEGATDFLWMLLLALLTRVGLDVAVAAAVGNALGAALAAGVLVSSAVRAGLRGVGLGLASLASLALLSSAAALAARAGFGTLLYGALVLCLADGAARPPSAARLAPYLALAVALLRPDGVVLGLVFLVGAGLVSRRAGELPRFARHAWIVFGLALAYFVWRRWYFGHDLPLPLYVKSNGSRWSDLPGLAANLQWLASRLGPAPFLAALALALVLARARWRATLRSIAPELAACAGFLLLFSLGRQTQNHVYRFQSAAGLLIVLAAWRATLPLLAQPATGRRLVAACLLFLPHAPSLQRSVEQEQWTRAARSYMDVFPQALARHLRPDDALVLTEAGRLAFHTDCVTIDAVGLNDAECALRPIAGERLRALRPAVVLFHVAGALAFPPLSAGAPALRALTPAELASAVQPGWGAVFEQGLAQYEPGRVPEDVAPALLARFLAVGDDYELWLARYDGAYRHVWALRRDLPGLDALRAELAAATAPAAWRPYLAGSGR